MNERFPQQLAQRLAEPLPSAAAKARFEPQPRYWQHYGARPADARHAAVLALLYPHDGQWHLPLTLRPAHMEDHAGQVSLPGGAIEPGETSRQAAVREFHEEVGAAGHAVELLGRLTTVYVHASNFVVTPWVAATPQRPELTPNPDEVEELIEVPLPHLLDPANFGSHRREYRGRSYTAPHFAQGAHRIWGATCLILGELVTLVEEVDG